MDIQDFDPLFQYISPYPDPGIRQYCGAEDEKYNVRSFDHNNRPNFFPSMYKKYNSNKCFVPTYPPGIESFDGGLFGFIFNVICCILLILLIIWLVRRV